VVKLVIEKDYTEMHGQQNIKFTNDLISTIARFDSVEMLHVVYHVGGPIIWIQMVDHKLL
jgi:hypothetical protein